MDRLQSANVIAMIIGILGMVFGIYAAYSGSEFSNYFFSLFIGFTLFGTAFFNYKDRKKVK